MKATRADRGSSQNSLLKLLESEFTDAQPAFDLFDEFLRQKSYNNGFCHRLLSVAKQKTGAAWAIRRLAILMLEHQILKLAPGKLNEFDFLLTQLKLKQAPGPNHEIVSSVLKEGYSTTDFLQFFSELRRKLERHQCVHDKIKGRRTSATAIREFIELSRRDCKLALARYLFSPEEVVHEILRQLRVTDGVKDLDTSQDSFVEPEMTRVLDSLPDFEAEILKRLCQNSRVYWVAEKTSAEINSLVEYPLTTVVLVIKPPGSDIEFEIKRAGRKGRNALNVVYARDGYTVPPSHRLDGGSMQWLLRYETYSAGTLSLIYRLVHNSPAPIAGYISRTTVFSIPQPTGSVQTLPYFTEPRFFGNGYHEMRVAMVESVAAFKEENGTNMLDIPGELGLTMQFVGHVQPTQSILCGTSSFRLDKLATYLSSDGPKKYFKEGLAIAYSKQDEQRLADELLQEVLGVYIRPQVKYSNYERYLDAALSIPENRVRANRIYLSLVQQIAQFWGTLLGVRGSSRGESFVARNVGLKSFWDKGEWNVRIIFMDHDAMSIPGPDEQIFYVSGVLPCMKIDERHIWDRSTPARFATSDVGYLQSIYRIAKQVDEQGQALADAEWRKAYKKTQHEMLTNPKLQSLFSRTFINRLLDWDTVVDGYVQTKQDKSTAAEWKRKMKKMLNAKGYKKVTLDCYLEFIEKNWEQLQPYLHLYKAEETASSDNDHKAIALASR